VWEHLPIVQTGAWSGRALSADTRTRRRSAVSRPLCRHRGVLVYGGRMMLGAMQAQMHTGIWWAGKLGVVQAQGVLVPVYGGQGR
jgi:hypothetical protein